MSQIPESFQGHDLTGWTYTRGYASNQAFDHVSRLAADGSVVTVYGDLSWIIVACTGQQIEGDNPEIKTPSDLDLVVQQHCGGWAPAPIGYEPPRWQPIETAPKDGETIIIADITTDGVVMEHYAAIYHPDYEGDDYCWKSLDYTLDPPIQGWLCVCPTHWRPLLSINEAKP